MKDKFTDSVFELIAQEADRQRFGLELIASENYVSEAVLRAMGSVLTNKYAEGLPGKRYYGGCAVVDQVESLCIERICRLFGAKWANVQPHSGAQANAAVMLALLNPGDSILGFDLAHGGHLTHGSPVNFSGKLYRSSFYGISKDTQRIDYDALEAKAHEVRPKLIICGASSYARDWDYARIRRVADAVGAVVLADIAHPAGLIAKGLLNNPLPHCHVVTTTTHKTLRGPRGGVILMQEDGPNPLGIRTSKGLVKKSSTLFNSAVFPGTQGGPLEHVIAAKAVAFEEAAQPSFAVYAQQVQTNARALGEHLQGLGYALVSGGTDNHLLLVDLQGTCTGQEAEHTLEQVGITVNKNLIPFDARSSLQTSGIRIGTAAITTRGLGAHDMETLAHYLHEALQHANDTQKLQVLRQKILDWVKSYPIFAPS